MATAEVHRHQDPHGEGLGVGLLQHPDQNRSQHPILLAVDQELGEGAGSGGWSKNSPASYALRIVGRAD